MHASLMVIPLSPLQARTLGPWSSAVALVNARGQAQADREGRIRAAAAAGDNGAGKGDDVAEGEKRDGGGLGGSECWWLTMEGAERD